METPITTAQSLLATLAQYAETALGNVIEWAPKLIAALAVLLIAYLVAKILGYIVQYGVNKTPLGKRSTGGGETFGQLIGRAVFWVVILIALPAVLGTLGLSSLVVPMQKMAEGFLAFLPNLVGALLIFGIGWAVASVVKNTVTSVLQAAQVDEFADRAGLARVTGGTGISKFLGVLVFVLLIVPIAIAALDALAIQSISLPAKAMLSVFLDAIPNIFAAAIVLLLAFIIGRFASDALTNLLPSLGFDKVGEQLGVSGEILGDHSPSVVAGYIAFVAIMVFGIIEAAKLLNFAIVSDVMANILSLAGHILLGSVIIAFGVVAANFVYRIVIKSKEAKPIAGVLKVAIIVLATAMGLRQMGLADEIIRTGFALLMGALAVGAAVAIGWGGKDTAGRLLEKWTRDL